MNQEDFTLVILIFIPILLFGLIVMDVVDSINADDDCKKKSGVFHYEQFWERTCTITEDGKQTIYILVHKNDNWEIQKK